jgi:hypothetical protein
LIDGDSADEMFGKRELMTKFLRYQFENSMGLAHDFGTDTVPW